MHKVLTNLYRLSCVSILLSTNFAVARESESIQSHDNKSKIITSGGYINRKKVRYDSQIGKTPSNDWHTESRVYFEKSSLSLVTRRKEIPVQHAISQTSDSLSLTEKSSRNLSSTTPELSKILIGPLMVLAEKITGGNYLEVLRLTKQVEIESSSSYFDLHRVLIQNSGLLAAVYRRFYPWGLFECLKGVPVLFVQSEAKKRLMTKLKLKQEVAENWSGFIGGASQAFFVCPIQKVKVRSKQSMIVKSSITFSKHQSQQRFP